MDHPGSPRDAWKLLGNFMKFPSLKDTKDPGMS